MRLILSAISLSLLAAAPLSAADLRTTHEELSVPPGKLNAKAFRPIKPQPCAVAQANPSGNRPAATVPARGTEACNTAKADSAAQAG